MYQWNFVRNLKRADAAQGPAVSRAYSPWTASTAICTVREFDEAYTAPHHGFRDAARLLPPASALRVVDRIRGAGADHRRRRRSVRAAGAVPQIRTSPATATITVVLTPHGGHCGFVSGTARDDDDGYWAERAVVEFCRKATAPR